MSNLKNLFEDDNFSGKDFYHGRLFTIEADDNTYCDDESGGTVDLYDSDYDDDNECARELKQKVVDKFKKRYV